MGKNSLLKTNILLCAIITAGFFLASFLCRLLDGLLPWQWLAPLAVLVVVLVAVSYVMQTSSRQLARKSFERQVVFRKATEQLYDSIYELDITQNRAGSSKTRAYFQSLGMPDDVPVGEALETIAQSQIQAEYRQGYVDTFCPENVMRSFEAGNTCLTYECPIRQEDEDYRWLRIDGHIYQSKVDGAIRMFTYRQNIDPQVNMAMQALTDAQTGLYNKTATEQMIAQMLESDGDKNYAFFIFDLDNFKRINDQMGHTIGDRVIQAFAGILSKNFRQDDVAGRIGGDEFVVFLPIPDLQWAEKKARGLVEALDTSLDIEGAHCPISASIGVAIAPKDGADFETLYQKADIAMYKVKNGGKRGYTIYEAGI